MSEVQDKILSEIRQTNSLLEQLFARPIIGSQVRVVQGLSEISESLGVVTAGEFRVQKSGNTADPGKGFTGLRIVGDAITVSGRNVHLAGINNDVLQVGINTEDGTLYSINAVLSGTITAAAGTIGGWTIGATSLSSASITLDSATPSIEVGAATDYLTGIGIFLGLNAGAYKFHVGDPAGNYIAWTGTALDTGGQWIHGTDNIEALSITAASIAASTITAGKLSVTSLDAITASMGALTVDGKLTMSGAGGAIIIGTTPPTSATVGTGLWIDRTGVYSLSANAQNATLTSAGLTAGAGAVKLNASGAIIAQPISGVLPEINSLKFYSADYSAIGADVGSYIDITGGTSILQIASYGVDATGVPAARTLIRAVSQNGTNEAYIAIIASNAQEGRVGVGTLTPDAALTIKQGSASNVQTWKSSDIAHGMTDLAETDTYGQVRKINATLGGLWLQGYGETTYGAALAGYVASGTTTKSIAALAPTIFSGFLKSGTGAGDLGANDNLAVFRNNATTRFILDADGDSHQDVGTAWTNFDDQDDIELLNSLAANVTRKDDPLRKNFGEWLGKNKDALEKAKLVTFNDDTDGRAFVNMSKLTMLLVGAVRQMAAEIEHLKLLQLGGTNV